MFTLAIPKSQQRRVNNVLGHSRSTPINFDFYKQDDGFYIFEFDETYDDFKDIVLLLKRNGVTTIGADEQLTESKSKMKKLTYLYEQLTNNYPEGDDGPSQGFNEPGESPETADEIIEVLKNILKVWETKEYKSDRDRYEQYYIDIETLVEDYEENKLLDIEDVGDIEAEDLNESYPRSLTKLYKKLNDKPLIEHEKTYGDLSDEEWEAEREKMGMKTDDEGNRYLDREYDPGNEPLEIQHSETGITYFINVEDIEAYVSGEEVIAVDPDRGMDAIRVTRDETDVVGVSEEELEDFLVSGDRSADDSAVQERKSRLPWHNWVKKWWQNHHENPDGMNEQPRPDYADVDGDGDEEESMEKAFKDKEKMDEYGCSEQEIEEGTCGYGKNGKIGRKPAGPHLMRERFKKLAGIKKKKLNG
jgi:hypothetical protein